MKVAVYPGSFDPITYGHIDIAKRALKVFDKLIILVSINHSKNPLFTVEERIDMIKNTMTDYQDRIEILVSDNLTVRQSKDLNATHIVRGLRAVTDFEYEFEMAHANRVLDKTIDSVFFMTDVEYIYLSSSTVKEIANFEGNLIKFVPAYVEKKLLGKLK